tara:strand:+ start:12255 stop:12584 length:330 start_codon:yes stop_codon:yes gene_type:complete
MRNFKDKIKIVFYSTDKSSVDFKIRLRHDGLSQSMFFSSLMDLYIQNDPDLNNIIEKIKLDKKPIGAKKLKKIKQDYEKGEDILKDLGISENDKQKIYDIIESEVIDYE